jgi:divalent metal cation (Fe/Co/Zn/Cd) transporter
MTTNHENGANHRAHLRRYAWLSIAAACLTIGMKAAAYYLTGSVGLLSDALESLVNLAGALILVAAVIITVTAVRRLITPEPLEQVGLGLLISIARFVSFHVLVPGEWSVHQGHQLLEGIEASIRNAIPEVTVFTHLESLEDPASGNDAALDRAQPAPADSPAV